MAQYQVGPDDLATGAVLTAGDDQQVFGATDRTLIGTGAAQHVNDGGFAYNSIGNNGGIQIGSGGSTLIDTTIQFGGRQEVYGFADRTTIASGATQTVHGSSDDTYVAHDARLILSPGYGNSRAQFTDIVLGPTAANQFGNIGGTLVVEGGTVLSGGYLNDQNGIYISPSIFDFQSGQYIYGGRIDLSFLTYGAGSASLDRASNILSVQGEGGGSYDIQLTGDYAGVEFLLSPNAFSDYGGPLPGTLVTAVLYCEGYRAPAGVR